MSSVTFPTAIGGDGSTVTDDDNATTGLRNGGWRTRFIPCFTNLVNIADYIVSYTAQTSTFAEPPPMGSTTPNTGAFTRVTVTGSTAPANGLYLPATNALGFATNSTERVRIDSSGNLGLGVTPSAWRTDASFKALQLPGGSFTAYMGGGVDQTPGIAANGYVDSGGTWRYLNSRAASWYIQNGGMHAWYNAPSGTAGNAISFTQAMTLDASGNLLVGQTSASSTTNGFGVYNTSSKYWCYVAGASSSNGDNAFSAYSTTASAYRFIVGYGGTIQATTTSITGISDISLKENIRPLETGLAEVLALQPRRFDWKNGDGKNIAGFVAQEVELILPDLVEDYQYTDDEVKRGLKMGDMIPTLVKAIQELSAELNDFKQKVNA